MRIAPINFTSFTPTSGVNNAATPVNGDGFSLPEWPYESKTPEQFAARKQLDEAVDAYRTARADSGLGLAERYEYYIKKLEIAVEACKKSFGSIN